MHLPRNSWLLVVLAVPSLAVAAQTSTLADRGRESGERAMFQQYIDALTAGTGVWVASNAEYQSEEEPFDAYKLAWRKGIGDRSAYGRMTSLRGLEESDAIWEMRLYWHSGEKQARIMQFSSSGIFTDGPVTITGTNGDSTVEWVQTFYPPGDEPFRVRQVVNVGEYMQHAETFRHAEDGWSPNRSYEWHRRRVAAPD